MLCDTIQNIFEKYGTDKARHTHYSSIYSELFTTYTPKRILEFGVWKGQSLYAWAELFPDAEIIGVDLFPPEYYCDNSCGTGGVHLVVNDMGCIPYKISIEHPNIKFIQGDLRNIAINTNFDLIIDDAGHTLEQQISTLKHLKLLNSPGVMVIEDVNVNYFEIIKKETPLNYIVKCHDLRGIEDECLMVIKYELNS